MCTENFSLRKKLHIGNNSITKEYCQINLETAGMQTVKEEARKKVGRLVGDRCDSKNGNPKLTQLGFGGLVGYGTDKSREP